MSLSLGSGHMSRVGTSFFGAQNKNETISGQTVAYTNFTQFERTSDPVVRSRSDLVFSHVSSSLIVFPGCGKLAASAGFGPQPLEINGFRVERQAFTEVSLSEAEDNAYYAIFGNTSALASSIFPTRVFARFLSPLLRHPPKNPRKEPPACSKAFSKCAPLTPSSLNAIDQSGPSGQRPQGIISISERVRKDGRLYSTKKNDRLRKK